MEALKEEVEKIKSDLENKFKGSSYQRTAWRKRMASLKKMIATAKQKMKSNPQLSLPLK